MSGDTLPVSVVIPTRNRPDAVRRAVDSVLAGNRVPTEIVVADQSDEPTSWPTRCRGVDIIHLPVGSVGLSRNRNAAIVAATCDVIAFIDDDIEVAPEWLDELFNGFLHSQPRGVVTGQVVPLGDGDVPSCSEWTDIERFEGRIYRDPLFTGNCAIGRQAFDDIGLFDARLGAGTILGSAEDSDYGFRLLSSGYNITAIPTAIAGHRGGRTGVALARHEWGYGMGQGSFYAKHLIGSRGFTGRRFLRNLRYRSRRLVRTLLRSRHRFLRTLVHTIALVVGFVAWPVLSRLGHGDVA